MNESEDESAPVAARPERGILAIDTHVDTPQRMLDSHDDIGERLPDGHLDLPRMREGGLTGAFFSIWVNPRSFQGEAAWNRALALIEAVRRVPEERPTEASLCVSADDIRTAHRQGRVAILMGVEGGHALGDPGDENVTLERLRRFHELGVRYMTLTWSNDNELGHSSSGAHPERGLTPLGERVVREMNRLGMIIDISHVSDQTFWDVHRISSRPLLASHSSVRALANHGRNMTDEMITAVAEGGGAVCINYYTQFIDRAYARRRRALEREHREAFDALRAEHSMAWQRWEPINALARELAPDLQVPTLQTLGAHFEHVVRLGGPGAACLGSDFDGIGQLPEGMRDVSELPNLRAELERRNLPVPAIFGENVLRVFAAQRP